MRLIFYRTPSFELSKKALLPHRDVYKRPHQNTAYYQSDFAFAIKMLREAARSDQPEDKLLLWLSRPSGTFCFRERAVMLKDTQAYNTWKFCCEQTHDRILAYAVELTGAANGTVQGLSLIHIYIAAATAAAISFTVSNAKGNPFSFITFRVLFHTCLLYTAPQNHSPV